MKRSPRTSVLAIMLAAIVTLSGCSLISDTQDPDRLYDRAETLEAQAAGHRRRAREYEILIKNTRKHAKFARRRIDIHTGRKEDAEKRIEELREEKRQATPQEARQLESLLTKYTDERDALQANIDDYRTRLKRLEGELSQQKNMEDSFMEDARKAEEEAERMREHARELQGLD
ncbi:MAG: hypothetical protein ACOCTQ_01610 [Planctomycetota bacterium]